MQPNFTLKKIGTLLKKALVVFCLGVSGMINSQTLSTASGTGYAGDFSINNAAPLSISFIIENTTASAVALTNLSCQLAPYFTATAGAASVTKLFYSSTSLSGNYDISTAAWTQIATGAATVPAALTITPVIAGINFIIPAATQYRFVIEASKGLAFSFTAPITPNTFSSGGLNLKVGNFQIAAQDIGYAGVSPAPAAGNHPAFFGGTATLTSTIPCTGTPVPGNTITSANPICPSVNFTLATQVVPAAGLTYQWQSASSAAGPWTNVGTNATLTTSQIVSTFYRCNVACGGNTATSAPLQVNIAPTSACYCTAGAASINFEKISNVTYGTINNNSTSTAGYENFTAQSTTMVRGQTTPISVSISGGFASDQVAVWIDFNQDGDFIDAGEAVYTSATGVGPHVGNITISPTALVGTTRMRIRMVDTDFDAPVPCGNSSFGQVEDYNVNIAPCIQGVFTSQPSSTSVQCSGNASFGITTTGSVLTYQWQQRLNAASPWTTISNGGVFSGATTTTLTLLNAPGTMDGNQFRAVMVGPCTSVDFSTPATLTVTPLVATVSPSAATICNGSIQQLTLTNPTSTPIYGSASNLPLVVPDGTGVAALSTIAISNVPLGAVVSNISVTFTMTHTWVGDVDINLVAPNGGSLNLVGGLNGGLGGNGTANFTNTVISSTSINPISGAAAPRTGTFAAEARAGYGPTGFIQNTALWSGLTSQLNGNWRIAIGDFGGGDVGTLISWSINIVYVAPPAQGVWTSSAPATMFTNALATVPYVAGSLANSIYVNPTASASYSVVYSTATPCVSGPTVIPVTVINPLSAVVNPANASACVGNNATFTVSAGGGPLTYLWQLSTDAGVTWTNITGATSSSLTLTAVTSSMNNNRYRAVLTSAPCVGSTNSGSATLTVNPLPAVTLTASDLSLTPGQTSIITASSNPAAASYLWKLNGVTQTGVTGNTFTANVDKQGTYVVTATTAAPAGCTSSAALAGTIAIGAEASDKLWIYPNPSPGAFQVRLFYGGLLTERRKVSIFNSAGQLIQEKEFTLDNVSSSYLRMDFDLSTLAAGTYVVKVNNRNTGKIVSGLVILQ